MANYKRKRPVTSTTHHAVGGSTSMGSWPRAHDVTYHRRPQRRRAKEVTRQVFKGVVDADNAAWPVGKKPHVYYW